MKATSSSLWEDYREGSRFFMQEGNVYETLRSLVARLDREGLDYAVIGAMALVAHGYRRFTEDVGILLTPEALQRFREKVEGQGLLPPSFLRFFRPPYVFFSACLCALCGREKKSMGLRKSSTQSRKVAKAQSERLRRTVD